MAECEAETGSHVGYKKLTCLTTIILIEGIS